MNCRPCNRGRFSGTAGWLLPAAILIVVPKCPVCLALYFALGTGIGISIATAARVQVIAIAAFIALLAYGVRRAFVVQQCGMLESKKSFVK